MSDELIYDLNTTLIENLDWDTISDGIVPEFLPILGYEDTTAPFVLYSIIPRIVSEEKYFLNKDYIRYYVYDNNYDRMMRISRKIREFLNVGSDEELAALKALLPTDCQFRITASFLRNAVSLAPIEREGFLNTANEFDVYYVAL